MTDAETDFQDTELLLPRVCLVWEEEEQPASVEQQDWTSSLKKVTSNDRILGKMLALNWLYPDPAVMTECSVVTQINILLHLSLWDFHSGTLTGRRLIHVTFLVILPSQLELSIFTSHR